MLNSSTNKKQANFSKTRLNRRVNLTKQSKDITQDELIKLGKRIKKLSKNGSESELGEAMGGVPCPTLKDRGCFYPPNYYARKFNIASYDPSAEETPNMCLAYEPL